MSIEFSLVADIRMSYDEAVMYCFFYSHQGKFRWRLPTFEEYLRYRFNELTHCWYLDDPLRMNEQERWYVHPVRDIDET